MSIKLVIKFIFVAFSTAIIFFAPTTSRAQLNYTFERLNSENGLPTNAIKGLQFDEKNRFLWIATESGIVRYNGHSFQNFGDISDNSNLNGRIVFFERSKNGTLFGKLINESIFKIQENKAVIDKKIINIVSQADFINYKYNLKQSTINNEKSAIEYSNFEFNGKVYFITSDLNKHLLRVIVNGQSRTLVKLTKGEQGFVIGNRWFLMQNDGVVKEVKTGLNDQLYFQPIFKFDIPILSSNIKLNSLKIFQNSPSDDIHVLLGTNLFNLRLIDNSFKFQLITDQIPKFEFIRHLQVDKLTNVIYIGTDNRGVIVARPRYFNRILPNDIQEGISTSTYAQMQLNNGNIQINTGQVFGDNTGKSNSIFNKPSSSLTFMSLDSILYYTNGDKIIEYDLRLSKIVNISTSKYFNENSFIEVGGEIYAFNEFGVLKKSKNSNWKLILRFTKTPYNFIVYQLADEKNGDILVTTTDGLYKYNKINNTFKLFFRDKSRSNFRAIYDIGGYFLLGTYGSGVYMYKNDTIKKFPSDQNLYLNYTHCFLVDNQDRIWASTNKGIFMSPKKTLINFWNNGPIKIVYKYFGKLDGIDVLELNGGCSPCAIKLKNGIFSFPGIDGLIQFNPGNIADLNIIPKLFLDKIIIDGNYLDTGANIELSSKTKKINIQLGISGMLSEENIRLEYKLDDNDIWTAVSIKDPTINIENLSFGKHKVMARLRSTYNPNWEIKEYDFNINYPIYLHPYMYFVYILISILLILLYNRFKTFFLLKRQRILEIEVAKKTNSLNKLNRFLLKRNQAKDHLIAIMNHDMLTPLKYLYITANNVAKITKQDEVKNSLNQIAKTSKELEYLTSNMLNWVKFHNIEILPIKQEIDLHEFVNDIIEFVKPFNDNEAVVIINNVPEGVIIKSWSDTLRVLLYNLIINAFKSTVKGSINISFTSTTKESIIVVKDTGIGMNASMTQYLITGNSQDGVEDLPKYKKGNGVGFQIIRHILKLMKASIKIDSKEGVGTIIYIHIPN